MRLHLPPTRALRLIAALVTVLVVVLLASVEASDPARPVYHHYVALGDSYTAAPFVPLTDVARGCYRSSNNYPQLLATALHIDDVQDRSCSGAQTKDLPGRQITSRGMTVAPQFGALSPATDLVTVGIGANNYRLYAQLATACRLSLRNCRLYDKRGSLGRIVDLVRPALFTTLEQIQYRAPKARILLVSYPRLLPPVGDCRKLPRYRPQDRATFRDINLRLRWQMKAAADEAGVEFVDFYAASYGHDVCSRDPWVQGRAGNSRQGAALHPLPAGQRALAELIEEKLKKPAPKSRT